MAKVSIVSWGNVGAADNLSAELWTLPDAADIASGEKEVKLTENEAKLIGRVFWKIAPEFAISSSLQKKIANVLINDGSLESLEYHERIQAKIVLNGMIGSAKEMADGEVKEAINKLLGLSSLLDVSAEDVSRLVEQMASEKKADLAKLEH